MGQPSVIVGKRQKADVYETISGPEASFQEQKDRFADLIRTKGADDGGAWREVRWMQHNRTRTRTFGLGVSVSGESAPTSSKPKKAAVKKAVPKKEEAEPVAVDPAPGEDDDGPEMSLT